MHLTAVARRLSLRGNWRINHAISSYGGAVDGYRTKVVLVDLGSVLFSFDHEHRLNVLGECLGLPPGRVDELL